MGQFLSKFFTEPQKIHFNFIFGSISNHFQSLSSIFSLHQKKMSPIASVAVAALENEINFYEENSVAAVYEREILKLNLIISKKNLKIEELEKKNNVFKKRLSKYYKQRNHTVAEYIKENDKLDDKLSKVKAERDGLEATNKKLVTKLSELEERIKNQLKKSMTSELESKIYFMKSEYKDQISNLESKVAALESNVIELEAEIELTGTIKDELQEELDKSKNEKTALQQKFDDAQEVYSNLEKKMKAAEIQIKESEKLKAELDTVKNFKDEKEIKFQKEIDQLNVEIDELWQTNDALKLQNDEIRKFVIEKQEKIKILLAQLFPSEASLSSN